MEPDKENLNFLHEEDLLPILDKLNVREEFLRGEIKCAICNIVLTADNLGSLYEESGEIKMICSKEECLDKVSK